MSQLILGALALAGVLWLLKSYTKARPTRLAKSGKMAAGVLAMAVGGLLLVRGRIDMAVPLFVFGAGLAGWLPGLPGMFGLGGGKAQRKPGGRSRIVSRFIEMELDLDSGAMRGRIVAGRLAGRDLDSVRAGRSCRALPRGGGRSRFPVTPRSLSRPPGARLA